MIDFFRRPGFYYGIFLPFIISSAFLPGIMTVLSVFFQAIIYLYDSLKINRLIYNFMAK